MIGTYGNVNKECRPELFQKKLRIYERNQD